ncbi:MAG: hypothetical protein J6Q81_01575 [Lentisphaeria bacterium]|nr:hypothetical protein [Lentisphaeria bacterium]
MRISKFLLACAALCLSATVFATPAPVKVGWALESIDPGRSSIMPGYGNFRYSFGCADPIYATCLVLENGKDSVIFVSLDIINPRGILPKVVKLAEKIAPELPKNKFFINATHTHSSLNVYYPTTGVPAEFNLMSGEEICDFLAEKIVKTAQKAWKNRKPGKVAWGYGLGVTSFNRRMVYFDDLSKRPKGEYGSTTPHAGYAVIHGRTNDDKFSGYENGSDNFIQFLYTFDMQGKLTGTLINTAATSQLSSGPQRKYTSDFWHDVREIFRKKYPGCYVLTQCSGAGDLMAYSGHFLEAEKRKIRIKYGEKFLKEQGEKCDWPVATDKHKEFLAYRKAMRMEVAERIFATFEDTLQWAKKDQKSNIVLRNKYMDVEVTPTPISKERLAQAHATLKKWDKIPYKTDGTLEERGDFNFRRTNSINGAKNIIERAERYAKGGKHRTGGYLVRVGDVAFAGNGFELFMDFMHRIQSRSPFIQTFVVELSGHLGKDQNGGYLATERAVQNRGYSATIGQCRVSPQGGQEFVDASLKGLKELHK